jgi:hypothetical protein
MCAYEDGGRLSCRKHSPAAWRIELKKKNILGGDRICPWSVRPWRVWQKGKHWFFCFVGKWVLSWASKKRNERFDCLFRVLRASGEIKRRKFRIGRFCFIVSLSSALIRETKKEGKDWIACTWDSFCEPAKDRNWCKSVWSSSGHEFLGNFHW